MKRASSTVTIYQKGLCRQAHRMDRLMRFLPVPTGGKPSKWSAFSEKKSLLTSHRSKGCVLVYGFEKKVSSFPTAHELSKWSAFSGVFSLHYPLESFTGFERKILKISSFSTHLTETGEVVRFFGNFFLPLPTGGKWAVWPKRSETFSLQYPLDSSGLFERKIFIFSFLQYPLDKNHRFDQKDLKFFLPVPNGHEGPF